MIEKIMTREHTIFPRANPFKEKSLLNKKTNTTPNAAYKQKEDKAGNAVDAPIENAVKSVKL